jgi:hypothetical protein
MWILLYVTLMPAAHAYGVHISQLRHEWRKLWEVLTSNRKRPWTFVTQIFRNG